MSNIQRKLQKFSYVLLLLAIACILLRLLPKPALSSYFPSSRILSAANGELLRLTLASDQQFRLWTPLAQIATPLQEAVLLYEDRYFYWHPGVNPWALLRASVTTASGARRVGASTISMQLARRIYHIDSRSFRGKLQQVAGALLLELRYSKHDILEAYLNSAPYGANIEGVATASLVYWRKPAAQLNLPEAMNLAVIPQNPRKRIGDTTALGGSPELVAARQRLMKQWLVQHPQDRAYANETMLALPFQQRRSLPFLAPHVVDMLLQEADQQGSTQTRIATSIDLPRQLLLERVLSHYLKTQADKGLKNASALLLDSATMQVQALVGSADYHNADIAGQVNGALGRRSPGSTLKPFIYGLALDQGLIHSASILKDAPTSFGAFSPENFDGHFSGPIPAHQALIRSRNIPAVELAAKLSKPNLYDFLKSANVQKLASESHYGLALALGGGEVSMEELAQLYAILPNHGRWQKLRYVKDQSTPSNQAAGRPQGLQLPSPEASYIVTDMLRQTPRPDSFAPARPAIAWKTGTSWSFRDAWTAGVLGRTVLVVWVGNFNGASNPALIGIEAAAPLFLRMVDALRAEKLEQAELPSGTPPDLKRLDVCVASGELPNEDCPVTAAAWFIAGKSPIRVSTLHKKILVDSRTGLRVCTPNTYTRSEVFETWSSDMQSLFTKAGMPLRQMPSGACQDSSEASDNPPRIISPLRGVTHIQRLHQAQSLQLRASSDNSKDQLSWFADDSLLGMTQGEQSLNWTPPRAGRYWLRVVDSRGLSDSRELVVEMVE